MKLTAENVQNTFFDCLFEDNEPRENYKEVHGVKLNVGFKPENLEKNKEKIISFTQQLPSQFHANSGGGYSFLSMCEDKDGNLWTGEHTIVDQLLCMGIAIDKMQILLPKEMWAMFPGCVPYVCVKQ